MNLLDSSAFIELIKGSERGKLVGEIAKKERVYMSTISLAEVSAWVYRNKGDVSSIIERIKKNVTLIDLDESLLIESGKLHVELRKTRKSIGLIDVIIYFSAAVNDLVLITKDRDFEGLANVDLM